MRRNYVDVENPYLINETVLNKGGATSPTLKTTVPSIVRKVLNLEAKDKLRWELDIKSMSVKVTKADNNDKSEK